MRKFICIILLLSSFLLAGYKDDKSFMLFNGMEIAKISECAFVYTYKMPIAGNYSANGMFYISQNKAVLIDTPGDDNLTDSLINAIKVKFNVSIEAVIITHWHMGDRLGGLNAAHKLGIKSYSSALTIDEAKKRNLPVPKTGFTKSLTLNIGGKKVECFYPGAGHTIDNSVVWFPSDKILFGGCLIKDSKATNLGNKDDADLKAWPETIKQVQKKFSRAKIIIPGHGLYDEAKLTLKHNLELSGIK